MIRRLIALAFALFPTAAFAQGPGPGPTPTPSPWTYAAPAIYAPAGSCITLPQTVTGGCPAGGNAINVSGGYYINGAQINSITTTSLPLQFSSGTLSLNINSSLVVSGSNLGINLNNINTWTVNQVMSASQGYWDLRSISGGNSSFIAVTPNGTGSARTYFGEEGTTSGQMLGGDGQLDAVIANTTTTGGIVFGTNATLRGKMFADGGFAWGANATSNDPGGNNVFVQGTIGVTGAVPPPTSGQGWIGGNVSNGLVLTGNGSGIDLLLENSANTPICFITHATDFLTCQNQAQTSNGLFVGLQMSANQSATVNNQFYSPALYLVGQGWKTNATAGTVEVDWAIYNQPIQGAAAPSSAVIFASRTGSNAFATSLQVMDGADSLPSVVVGAGTPIPGAAQGDLQVGRGVGATSQGFIFFDTTGNEFLGFNGTYSFHTGAGSIGIPNGSDTVALLAAAQNITSKNIDSSPIGSTTPSTGKFTTVTDTGLTTQGTVCNSAAGLLSTTTTVCAGLSAPARNQTTPGNPTGTSNTSAFTMAGLSNGVTRFTPNTSGNVQFIITGTAQSTADGDGCQMKIQYGTGNGPANNAAITGTTAGTAQVVTSAGANAGEAFAVVGYATGLTLATAYYYDLAQAASTGGTCTLTNITMNAMEQPSSP